VKRRLCGLLFCLLVVAWIILLIIQQPPEIAGDFYPIYFGALKLLAGQDPYSAEASREMARLWLTPYAAGFPYPLPMALICIPLVLLPLPLSMWLWTLFGTFGSFAAIRLGPNWRKLVFLPLVFAPLYTAILVKQGTLVWFALTVLFLFAMRWRLSWLVGLCIALLPIKPQVSLFFALAGLVWAWKNDRKSLYWAGGWGVLIWGGSFVLMPTWSLSWLEELNLYRAINQAPTLLPWSLVLIAVTWRMSWPARLAAAQVAIFPLSSVYTLLPLLLVWIEIGGSLALIGAGVSLFWLAFQFDRSAAVLWTFTAVPLIICAAWRWRQSMQRIRPIAHN
jgi:hypothetical protein